MKIYNLSKPYLVLFFLIVFYQNVADCQEKYKFGEVSMEEMEMKTYPNDSSANAVVLYEDGYTNFDYEDGFILSKELKERIKILKQEGVDLATVTTTCRVEGSEKERILDIEACAYNLEHGKIVTSKLDKKFIFEEKLSDNVYQVKFAIPNVKVGTVIEYKIKKTSPFYYSIPDWYFQRTTIPVKYSRFHIIIPEYFIYHINIKGYEQVIKEEKQVNENIHLNHQGDYTRIPYIPPEI